MKISVIIPVYNVEKYLRQCLDSLLAQTYGDWDAVLIDDGSTDASGKICDEYAALHPRFSVVHQENRGQAAARNRGIDCSKGEAIAFVDADDMIAPDYLVRLVTMMIDSNADMAMCAFFEAKECRWPKQRWKRRKFTPREAILDTLYQKELVPSPWCKAFRRSILGDVRFREGTIYEDLDFFYRLLENVTTDIPYTPDALYFYRTNPDSTINTFKPQRLDVLDVVDRIEEHYADDKEMLAAAHDRKFAANCNMYLLMRGKEGYKAQRAKCHDVINAYRSEILLNPRSRLKNKLGALLLPLLHP